MTAVTLSAVVASPVGLNRAARHNFPITVFGRPRVRDRRFGRPRWARDAKALRTLNSILHLSGDIRGPNRVALRQKPGGRRVRTRILAGVARRRRGRPWCICSRRLPSQILEGPSAAFSSDGIQHPGQNPCR